MLFIPITTLSLSTLVGQQIGQGAAFTGMMRQLGGSFGIAVITTFIANRNMVHRSNLVTDLNINDPAVQQRITALKSGFLQQGLTPDAALQAAYKILDFNVTKQSAVLSYMDVFLYLGILFLICIPFILFIRNKNKTGAAPDLGSAMH